jgi:phosphopantothenoylcysteine decarboxylase
METFLKTSDMLKAPLTAEQIETEIRVGGKLSTKVIEIGSRVAAFQETIEKEEAQLAEYWRQWDDVQNEYISLGLEVFGPEAFSEISPTRSGVNSGYKIEMELLDTEDNTRIEEMDEEIKEVRVNVQQEMEASEKVW